MDRDRVQGEVAEPLGSRIIMMHIANIEEIQGMLLRVPELVNCFERRDPGFAEWVKDWLVQAEQVLVNNRLAAAADVAVLRGMLISAERGILPSGIEFNGKKTARKIKDAAAMDALRMAEELVSSTIKIPAAQVYEGERVMRQLVALAQRKGLIPEESEGEHAGILKAAWRAISHDPELGQAAAHLAGLVGAYDALILLDRMLPANP